MFEPIQKLNQMSIPYIVIGTWAMLLNGIPSIPRDIDIWLDYSNLKNHSSINSFIFHLGNKKITHFKTDFFITYRHGLYNYNFISKAEGLDFNKAVKNAQTSIIDNIDIKFLCLSDILSNKISVGRENDIIDILKIKKYG